MGSDESQFRKGTEDRWKEYPAEEGFKVECKFSPRLYVGYRQVKDRRGGRPVVGKVVVSIFKRQGMGTSLPEAECFCLKHHALVRALSEF